MTMCAGLLLRSHLERHGFEVHHENYIDSANAEAAFARLRDFDPEIVVLSTTFVLTRKHMATLGKRFRRELPDAFLVAGGHHVHTTLMYLDPKQQADYLKACRIDGFINDSQGEGALLALCQQYPDGLDRIPNLLWRDRGGESHLNDRQREENDVNSTVIDLAHVTPGSVVHIRTARSCGFKCAFCSYPMIAGPLALMELDAVIGMLHQAQDVGVKAMFFIDDTFNVPRERFEALIDRMIEENIVIPWYSFLRCQYVDEQLVEKMARTGCAGVFLGVESGSDDILKKMKKGAITRFYRNGIRWLKENGIVSVGSFIVGFPGETADTVARTHEFIEQSGLDYYFIQPFYYLHHTPVHKRAEEFGLKGNGLMWRHDTMNWQQALDHLSTMFTGIENSTFVNPDYTLWEIAYLRSKGLSDDDIRGYRRKINRMTADQMRRYAVTASASTSRQPDTAAASAE
jgi:radical SAM superfamily enzyme YgiQ (UPF0313 family)